jgi:hypothetical protein
MSQFDDYAREKMQNLMATRGEQVGSMYPGDKTGRTQTNCIDFVTKVLVYAYEKMGRKEAAAEVKKRVSKGTDLAKYLVESRNWRAHYWNPDVKHPRDLDSEHPYSHQLAVRNKKYYKIPLAGAIVNFLPTPVASGGTTAKSTALNRFKLVPFAVGIARGGYHTFLCSYGKVYEVHWNQPSDGLYGVSDFGTYKWLSGVVVVPPKTAFKSDAL